jgi:hypothetical protein
MWEQQPAAAAVCWRSKFELRRRGSITGWDVSTVKMFVVCVVSKHPTFGLPVSGSCPCSINSSRYCKTHTRACMHDVACMLISHTMDVQLHVMQRCNVPPGSMHLPICRLIACSCHDVDQRAHVSSTGACTGR